MYTARPPSDKNVAPDPEAVAITAEPDPLAPLLAAAAPPVAELLGAPAPPAAELLPPLLHAATSSTPAHATPTTVARRIAIGIRFAVRFLKVIASLTARSAAPASLRNDCLQVLRPEAPRGLNATARRRGSPTRRPRPPAMTTAANSQAWGQPVHAATQHRLALRRG